MEPATPKKIIQVPISIDLYQQVNQEAERNGQSMAAYVRLLLINSNKLRITHEPSVPTLN